jgi:hypothetical protein
MKGKLRKRLLTGVAVAAVVAGMTTAVVMAAQPTKHHHNAGRSRSSTLTTAATYLGVSAGELRTELQTGKSLAEVADATGGKSAAGLIQALERAQRHKLAAAAASVQARVTTEVNRKHGRHDGVQAAASYLGVSAARLRADVRAGKTLAEVANTTAGKSEAGLVEALVNARKAALASAVSSGAITQAQANAALPHLASRTTARVRRTHAGGARPPATHTGAG